jgi:5'-3' exonuclease
LDNADEITKNAVREKIQNGKEEALMSQYLATIVRDLDINFDFDRAKVELPEIKVSLNF